MFKIYSKVYNCFANYDVRHSKNEFDNNHINGIKNFQGYSKYRLSKFTSTNRILLYIKECEFKYNTKTTQKLILKNY